MCVAADLSRFRPVYAPKDFLEVSRLRTPNLYLVKSELHYSTLLLSKQVLISLRNPNHDSSEDISIRSHWGVIQVPLNVRDIPQLVGICLQMLGLSTIELDQSGFEICFRDGPSQS